MADDDTMSQSQVESLLRAMESGGKSSLETADAQPARPAAPLTPPLSKPASGYVSPRRPTVTERVIPYDFKRPERVGKEQMRAIHSLHEAIARNFGAVVSNMLRTMVEVKLLSVDQMTYSEFVFSLENPSCFNVLTVQPLEGNWILDIAPSLSYAVIDRMLGGDAEPGPVIRRPLTEIENRLVGRLVTAFLVQLHEAWQNVAELELAVHRVESNPQLVQIVPPNEVVILVCFEVTLGKNRGLMNICIPFNTVERFNAQLANKGWVGYGKTKPTEITRQTISSSVDVARVEVVVTLAKSKIRTAELLDLAVGDVITTEQDISAPLELAIQGVPKFNARPGAFRGKKAVSIEGLIEP
jgi:flagellar motor switch protein FliM